MLATYRQHATKSLLAIFLALVLALVPAAGFAAMAEETYGSWTEYKEAKGLTDFTWNQVTDAIEEVLAEAATAYSAGDSDKALSLISAAKNKYWSESGLKIQMQKNLPSANKKTVETDFMNLNNVVNNGGSAEDFTTAADVLTADNTDIFRSISVIIGLFCVFLLSK